MDIHFAIAIVVFAWFIGFGAGTLVTLGTIELITGRMIINPERMNWSVGEARVRGAVFATAGVLIGMYVLIIFIGLLGIYYQTWVPSPWWYLAPLAWIPIAGVGPVTGFLLEQHRLRRWPFDRPQSTGQ